MPPPTLDANTQPQPTGGNVPAQHSPSPSPSASLFNNLRLELARVPPFSQMVAKDIDFFVAHATQRYFAPDEPVLNPGHGVVGELLFIRQGAVVGERGLGSQKVIAFEYEKGDLFPISAAVAQRPVSSHYKAVQDTFVLACPVQAMRQLAAVCGPFSDFLNGRIQAFLELSRREVQMAFASRDYSEQAAVRQLGDIANKTPLSCLPDTPLQQALGLMHAKRVGSILVTNENLHLLGILTRYDILGKILLAGTDLQTPISQVMVQPVRSLSTHHTAQDAAILMSRFGIRHVPVTRDGVLVGIVSERDLFAMQRLSLKQVNTAIRSAQNQAELQAAAQEIRQFAHKLLGQGVQSRQLTELISHLNDVLTERLLQITSPKYGINADDVCWIALGSEGRSEQTIATDQDNALILADHADADLRARAQAFALEVNHTLDACGYPLCKGGVMASSPGGTLTLSEWRQHFAGWIAHGAPEGLLKASIYFDFRALYGNASLTEALRVEVVDAAQRTPSFLKQMALNALRQSAPLNWLGQIDTDENDAIDLKLQGTALFVECARIQALAHGIRATNTRERLETIGRLQGVKQTEYEAWVGGFEFLQTLRLRRQLASGPNGADPAHPNRLELHQLNDIDRRILKECLRVARCLQQVLQLDFDR